MTERNAEHARFAPSGADIWARCTAAIAAQEVMPPEPDGDEAAEGTAAHWLLAQTLLGLSVPEGAIAPNGVPITADMRQAIVEMVDDFNATAASFNGSGDSWFYQIETRVAAHTTIHRQNDGTPDLYAVNWTRQTIYVWDYKHGHGFVDVFENLQLINYFAAIFETDVARGPFMRSGLDGWRAVFTIAQPRCYVRDELGAGLRSWHVDAPLLSPFIDQLENAAILADTKPEHTTGEHCRYCRAIVPCQANARAASAAVDVILQGVNLRDPSPTDLGRQLQILNEAVERAKHRLTAVEAHALATIEQGRNVPGYKLGWSVPRMTWAKEMIDFAAAILASFGLDVRPGLALPTPNEAAKQGVDAAVIKPYTFTPPASKKLVRANSDSAEKTLGRR